jgi:hypothetical protein
MQSFFNVKGKPFFVLGGQVHNSSGYNLACLDTAWQAASLLKVNTLEIPVYWEQVEPVEGIFNFTHLDEIIQAARQRRLHLVLLWFATWKNGNMQYAPRWVKEDITRFARVINPAGSSLWVLSSHCQANLTADRGAFCQLMAYLKAFDSAEGTVIAVQVENEPGILGCVRDHGAQAESEFTRPAPEELVQALAQAGESPVRRVWQHAGAKPGGDWRALFGEKASEYFSAWSIARYIDQVTQAGKAIYDVAMYVNVWLGEGAWGRPGASFPSGGAVSSVIDLWKWAAPHIDLIAPDIYIDSVDTYRAVCAAYADVNNTLFVPESGGSPGNAVNLFEAVSHFGATGYAIFGIESLLAPDGNLKPEAKAAAESFHCLAAALPLIIRYRGTGKMHGVAQHEFMGEQHFDFGAYLGAAYFNGNWQPFTDFRHTGSEKGQRGRGLIFVTSEHEFYLVGAGYRLMLKKKVSEEAEFAKANDFQDGPMTPYLSVEEGHFQPDGSWVCDRCRNGDEITNGLWAAADVGVVRAVLAS